MVLIVFSDVFVQIVVRSYLSNMCSRLGSDPFKEGVDLTKYAREKLLQQFDSLHDLSKWKQVTASDFPLRHSQYTRNRFHGRKCDLDDDIEFQDDDTFTQHIRTTIQQSPLEIDDNEENRDDENMASA
jgi:hypothetical protein